MYIANSLKNFYHLFFISHDPIYPLHTLIHYAATHQMVATLVTIIKTSAHKQNIPNVTTNITVELNHAIATSPPYPNTFIT